MIYDYSLFESIPVVSNDILDTSNKDLTCVDELNFVVLSAELPLVEVIGHGLAVEDHSASTITSGGEINSWTIDVSVVSVLHSSSFISLDLVVRVVVETLWAQILQVVSRSVVILLVPDWLVILVGVVEVECVSLVIDWKHCLWVQVHHVEAWWFALVSCG